MAACFTSICFPKNGVEGDARLNLALAIAGNVGIAGGVYNKKR
jgi:hypothetical protein